MRQYTCTRCKNACRCGARPADHSGSGLFWAVVVGGSFLGWAISAIVHHPKALIPISIVICLLVLAGIGTHQQEKNRAKPAPPVPLPPPTWPLPPAGTAMPDLRQSDVFEGKW